MYTRIYCEYAKCKSILRMQIFEVMKISTKHGKLASKRQTTEIWSQRKSLITLFVTICFQIFFLAYPQECKRRLAILDDIGWCSASSIQFVISANVCLMCPFTWRVIFRFFSVIRFRWSASSMQIFHILSIFPSLQKFAYARLTYI